jgi:hypothetical protein
VAPDLNTDESRIWRFFSSSVVKAAVSTIVQLSNDCSKALPATVNKAERTESMTHFVSGFRGHELLSFVMCIYEHTSEPAFFGYTNRGNGLLSLSMP